MLPAIMLAALLSQFPTADAKVQDLAALDGTWKPTSAQRGDLESSEEELERQRMTIRNSRYWVPSGKREGYKPNLVEIRIDATKTPKHIDFVVVEGPNVGMTELGIYELNGDELKVCSGKSRPTKFEARVDDWNALVVTYQRVKP